MKKHLLFGLGLSVCFGVAAQRNYHAVKQNTLESFNNQIDKNVAGFYQSTNNSTVQRPALTGHGNRAVVKKMFTSSWNPYGVIVSDQNSLNANQATNTVAFIHRISQDWAPAGVNSGFIQCTFTSDNGATWDSILLNQDQTNLSRYPTGTLYNPSGNTAKSGLFAVASGPITDGTSWQGNYFASGQLDGTNNNVKTDLNNSGTSPVQHFTRINMQSTDSKVIVTGALMKDVAGTTAATQGYRGAMLNYGTYAAGNYTWAVDSIKPMFKTDPTDGAKQAYSTASHAWSQDGQTGYVVFVGVDSLAAGDQRAYQPIVYKTTNGGTAWTQMPLGNFSTIAAINPYLIPSNQGTKKAWYVRGSGFTTLVDSNGELHIVCVVNSGASDAADSLGFTWTRNDNKSFIFDTYTTSTGWDAFLVDSLLCITGSSFSPFNNAGTPEPITARLQASMNDARTKIFYSWIDTDPTLANGENVLPDIFAKGRDIATNLRTPTVQFTNDGVNFYMFAPRTALTSGTTYSIPMTTSDSRGGTGDALQAFDHYYIAGVEFNESDFTTGIDEIASDNGKVIISQNYPNPFSKETSINVTLKEGASVSLDVYNAIGQKVNSQTQNDLSAGVHTFKVDAINLNAGIYFYSVKVGNTTLTRKMIVR